MNPSDRVYNVKCEADLAPPLAAQHSMSDVELCDDTVLRPGDLHLQPPRLALKGGFARGVASLCNSPPPEIQQAGGIRNKRKSALDLRLFDGKPLKTALEQLADSMSW